MPSTRSRKPCTKCWRDCSPSPTTSRPASSCTLSQSSVASALARSSSAPLGLPLGPELVGLGEPGGLGQAAGDGGLEHRCRSSFVAARRRDAATRRLRYRRRVTADADSTADDADAPLAATERIAALDVLRGFALLGIFIMNMPGFSHSLFAAAGARRGAARRAGRARCASSSSPASSTCCSASLFGIGFALQMARLDAPNRRARPARRAPRRSADARLRAPARRSCSSSASSTRCCSGRATCSLIYALLGFVLLAVRRVARPCAAGADRRLPASSRRSREALRPTLLSIAASRPSPPSSTSSSRPPTTSPSARARSSTPCARRRASSPGATARRSACSSTPSFFVQMATGILLGFVVGRRGWPRAARRRGASDCALSGRRCRRGRCGGVSSRSPSASTRRRAGVFVAALARTIGRAALAAFYALTVAAPRRAPRRCRAGCARSRLPAACRSATTCCRPRWPPSSSTAGASASGAGRRRRSKWRSRIAPLRRRPAAARSAWWLRAFATGRWSTSGAASPTAAPPRVSANASASNAYEVRRTAGS